MSTTGSTRSFVAVEVGEPARTAVQRLVDGLRGSTEGVRWARPEQMHVTLKFLGDIDNRDLPQVCQSLEDACQEVEPFTAWVRDLGSFPTGKPPRVIWAGIDDGDEHPMQIIHAKLDAGLAELGVPREGRLFSPHLTLGRIIRGRASSQLTKLIHQAGLSLATQFQVDEVQLIASLKDRGGMRYEPISTVEL